MGTHLKAVRLSSTRNKKREKPSKSYKKRKTYTKSTKT